MFNLIRGVLGGLGGSGWKIVIILGLISSLAGFVVYYDKQRYNAGYNAAVVEMQAKHEEALSVRVDEATEDLSNALTQAEKRREQALKLIEELRNKPVEVRTRVVREIIENAECERLGIDYMQLLNQSIGSDPRG